MKYLMVERLNKIIDIYLELFYIALVLGVVEIVGGIIWKI